MLIFSRFLSKNAGYYSHFFVIIDREAERGEAAEAERGETAGAERGKTLPCPTALTITSGPALQKPGCGFILQPAGGCCCAVQPLFFIPPYAKARARIYPPGGTGHSFGTYDGLGSSSLRNM